MVVAPTLSDAASQGVAVSGAKADRIRLTGSLRRLFSMHSITA
jgi:hypothetical protein